MTSGHFFRQPAAEPLTTPLLNLTLYHPAATLESGAASAQCKANVHGRWPCIGLTLGPVQTDPPFPVQSGVSLCSAETASLAGEM